MKKKFKLENLDCAHCASRMEASINKLDGVTCSISFMAQKLTIEANDADFDRIVDEAQKLISAVDKDCIIIK